MAILLSLWVTGYSLLCIPYARDAVMKCYSSVLTCKSETFWKEHLKDDTVVLGQNAFPDTIITPKISTVTI